MSAEDFEGIKAEFGEADANISQEEFLALKDAEADVLIGRVEGITKKAKLRVFRKNGK
jgi:hypothetical protein